MNDGGPSEKESEVLEKLYHGIRLGDLNLVEENLPLALSFNRDAFIRLFESQFSVVYDCRNPEVFKYLIEEMGIWVTRLSPAFPAI